MLLNNIAYLYLDEESLQIYKDSSCNVGMIIGSKKDRKGIVKEIVPILTDYISIFNKVSDFVDEYVEDAKDNLTSNDEQDMTNYDQILVNSEIFGLTKSEIQKLEKICLISNMIPSDLFFMGIFIKCLNDDNKPVIKPKNVLNMLNKKFGLDLRDFVVLIMNKITFAKIQCNSANFGNIDLKRRVGIKAEHDLLHFSLKSNLEVNRLFHVKDKNFNEIIDTFYFTLKNIIDNSFYSLRKNSKKKYMKFKQNQVLKENEEISELSKNEELEIMLMMPMNLMDFDVFVGKNSENVDKTLIKFRCKIVLHFYLSDDLKYSDLIQEVKNKLLEYAGENIELLLADKYLDVASPTIFCLDIDNKYYINYRDSIHFLMDQSKSTYNIDDVFDIFDLCYLENSSSKTGNKFYNLKFTCA